MSTEVIAEGQRPLKALRVVIGQEPQREIRHTDKGGGKDYKAITVNTPIGRMFATEFNGLQFRQLNALELGDVLAIEIGAMTSTAYLNRDKLVAICGVEMANKILASDALVQRVDIQDFKIVGVNVEEFALPGALADRLTDKEFTRREYATSSGGAVMPPSAGGVGTGAAPVAGADASTGGNPDEEKPY